MDLRIEIEDELKFMVKNRIPESVVKAIWKYLDFQSKKMFRCLCRSMYTMTTLLEPRFQVYVIKTARNIPPHILYSEKNVEIKGDYCYPPDTTQLLLQAFGNRIVKLNLDTQQIIVDYSQLEMKSLKQIKLRINSDDLYKYTFHDNLPWLQPVLLDNQSVLQTLDLYNISLDFLKNPRSAKFLFPQLTTLKLVGKEMPKELFTVNMPNLQFLKLSGGELPTEMPELFSGFTKLEELILTPCNDGDPEQLSQFIEKLLRPSAGSLAKLSVHYISFKFLQTAEYEFPKLSSIKTTWNMDSKLLNHDYDGDGVDAELSERRELIYGFGSGVQHLISRSKSLKDILIINDCLDWSSITVQLDQAENLTLRTVLVRYMGMVFTKCPNLKTLIKDSLKDFFFDRVSFYELHECLSDGFTGLFGGVPNLEESDVPVTGIYRPKPSHPLQTLKFEIFNNLTFIVPMLVFNFTNLKHIDISGYLQHRFIEVKKSDWPNYWNKVFLIIVNLTTLETLTLTDLDYSPQLQDIDTELAFLKTVFVKPYGNMSVNVNSLGKLFPVNSQLSFRLCELSHQNEGKDRDEDYEYDSDEDLVKLVHEITRVDI